MHNFGLVVAYTGNLGDDIQTLSALQYLPRVDVIIDRDKPRAKLPVRAIFNGWYTHEPYSWLPSPSIWPLFISMHLAPFASPLLLSRHTVRRLFTRFGPVGARDLYTLGVLRGANIPSYFSGCLTLTLDYGFKTLKDKSRNYILIIDFLDNINLSLNIEMKITSQAYHRTIIEVVPYLPDTVRRLLRSLIPYALVDNLNYRVQRVLARRYDVATRLVKALWRVAEIAAASLVVTSRLHVALPALAFDVPVVFVHENLRDPRFWGLTDFMNVYTPKQFRELSEKGGLNPKNFDIPRYEQLQELKVQLVERTREFVREG